MKPLFYFISTFDDLVLMRRNLEGRRKGQKREFGNFVNEVFNNNNGSLFGLKREK